MMASPIKIKQTESLTKNVMAKKMGDAFNDDISY